MNAMEQVIEEDAEDLKADVEKGKQALRPKHLSDAGMPGKQANQEYGPPIVAEVDTASSIAGEGAENLNVRAAVIHMLGDMIQSIGVIVAAVIIYM